MSFCERRGRSSAIPTDSSAGEIAKTKIEASGADSNQALKFVCSNQQKIKPKNPWRQNSSNSNFCCFYSKVAKTSNAPICHQVLVGSCILRFPNNPTLGCKIAETKI